MAEDTIFTNEYSIITNSENSSTEYDIDILQKQINQLSSENDDYKQQIYDLRRKLDMQQKLNDEMVEDNECSINQLRNNLQKQIKEITERYNSEKERHEKDIKELETALINKEKEIAQLNEDVKQLNSKIENNNQNHVSVLQSLDDEEKLKFEKQIQELNMILENEIEKSDILKEEITSLISDKDNLKEILNITIQASEEKSQLLDNAREELILCQAELNSLKNNPNSNSNKGNSVFVELEDSRNKVVEQLKLLKSTYLKMKQHYKVLDSENSKMKSERAKLIREWSDESCTILVQQNKLKNSYDETILKLQQTLENERVKCRTILEKLMQQPNISFLQIQIVEQKKEMDKLRSLMESDYYQKCLQQQQLEKALREVRFWKYQALALKDSTQITKSELNISSKKLLPDSYKLVEDNKESPLKKKHRTIFLDDDITKSNEDNNAPIKAVKFKLNEEILYKENLPLISEDNNLTSDKLKTEDEKDNDNIKHKTENIKLKSGIQKKYTTIFIPSKNE